MKIASTGSMKSRKKKRFSAFQMMCCSATDSHSWAMIGGAMASFCG
jgi:hypothetical protein